MLDDLLDRPFFSWLPRAKLRLARSHALKRSGDLTLKLFQDWIHGCQTG
jgi:hypothetical protein